jgi:hypothetical protein
VALSSDRSCVNADRTISLTLALATAILALATVWLACNAAEQIVLMEADERPWVGLDKYKSSGGQKGESFDITLVLKNGGKSPALRTRTSFAVSPKSYTKYEDRWKNAPQQQECFDCSNIFLLPGTTAEMHLTVPAGLTDEPNSILFIVGRSDYEDAFKHHYWTRTCLYYEPAVLNIRRCPLGNDVNESDAGAASVPQGSPEPADNGMTAMDKLLLCWTPVINHRSIALFIFWVLIIRVFMVSLRWIERHSADHRVRDYLWDLSGFHPERGEEAGKENRADFWLPTIVGAIELCAYPVLMVMGDWSIIGAWIGFKTLAQWKAWSENRNHFNRYLVGTAVNVIVSLLVMTHYVHRIC